MSNLSLGFHMQWPGSAGCLNAWRLNRWAALLPKIDALAPVLEKLADDQIHKQSLALRYRAKSGEPLDRLLVEGYALAREAARRTIGLRHFDVQLLGGIAMFHHAIVEMQTGEGKTLTATLPMYLHALAGRGCHLATVNDYLARRDAEWMGPVYRLLGMSVGVIEAQMPTGKRREAYACDVTYGTAKEFGFDFLRDRLLLRQIGEGKMDLLGGMLGHARGADEKPVQGEPHFALVDEADSILIDEARTPLIISALPTEEERQAADCFRWSASVAGEFAEDVDYEYDNEKKTAELSREGRQKVRSLSKTPSMDSVGMVSIYQYVEQAIMVRREYQLDRQYVVRDGEIVIVDEFTGRLGEGRKWRDGVHQAVEAKQGVEVTVAAGQAARITVQDFFLRYKHLAGMTGTAMDSAGELRRIYRCRVLPIPTHRPAVRRRLRTRVFGQAAAKWAAIVEEIRVMHAKGRPVLIGTRSIDKSELLSKMLAAAGVEHQVLNANHIAAEAEIVGRAGLLGHVTVSTNMAGRGTDIRLGDGVAELGGLHVICTEMHDSSRIDRQLIGRCGRQGDPGTYRQYMALDDDLLLAGLGPKKSKKLQELGAGSSGPFHRFAPLFRKAQRKIEKRHFRQRKTMMYYERERKKTQRQMGQDPYLDSPS